jgi:hypothetical protein
LKIVHDDEYRTAVAAFIYVNGVTRCPTACVLPTQGTVPAADRAALEDYAIARARQSHKRLVGLQQSLPIRRQPGD